MDVDKPTPVLLAFAGRRIMAMPCLGRFVYFAPWRYFAVPW
jgi:hypothetical protein